jgi:septum formation protein
MHHLYSALVLFEDGKRVWQHIGTAHLTMRVLGEAEMAAYVALEWERIRHSVGGYQIEGAGIQLFQEILGDYFTVLGLPLLPLLLYLRSRGFWGDA